MPVDPFHPVDDDLLDFFTELADGTVTGTVMRGKTVASYRASVAQTLEISSGVDIRGAAMPRASKILDKITRDKPARARYDDMWNVDQLFEFIKREWKDNKALSTKDLRAKTVTLWAVANFMRPSDVAKTGFSPLTFARDLSDVQYRIWDPKEERLRRNRSGVEAKWSAPQTCDAFRACSAIDPVRTLKAYCDRVAEARAQSPTIPDRVFISLQRSKQADGSLQFTSLKGDTVSNIVQKVMEQAGIDVSVFKGASARHAGASRAIDGGADYVDVLAKGRWTNFETFRKFYMRAHKSDSLTSKVMAKIRPKRRMTAGGADAP